MCFFTPDAQIELFIWVCIRKTKFVHPGQLKTIFIASDNKGTRTLQPLTEAP